MNSPIEARAILAAAHTLMPADVIAAHAAELAYVVASQNETIAALCETISRLTGEQSTFIDVEASWPTVYNAGAF